MITQRLKYEVYRYLILTAVATAVVIFKFPTSLILQYLSFLTGNFGNIVALFLSFLASLTIVDIITRKVLTL